MADLAVDPAVIRRAVARTWRKQSHGARRMPDYVVHAMYEDYQKTRSLAKTGAKFDRHGTSLKRIFELRGLRLFGRGGANHRVDDAEARLRYAVYLRAGSMAAAAKELGCTHSTLSHLFAYHGLPTRRTMTQRKLAA